MINTDLLYKKLIDKPELANVPILHIVSVAVAVIELLNDSAIVLELNEEDIA